MKVILVVLVIIAITIAGPIEENPDSNFERIITDINDVKSGVSIDYNYNETIRINDSEGGSVSAPGCPKSELGYPWVYYYNDSDTKETGDNSSNYKCYLAGQTGPCKRKQRLFVERGNPVGFCNCACFEDVQLNLSTSSQVQFCRMSTRSEVVFFPGSRRCYELMKQGPCNENEWLVKTSNKYDESSSSSMDLGGLVECEERRCREGSTPFLDYSSTGNHNNKPLCLHGKFFHTLTSNIGGQNCPENMKYSSLLNKCLKKFTFVQ